MLGRQISSAVTEGGASFRWTSTLGYDDASNLLTCTSPAPHNYVSTTTYYAAGEPTKTTDHTGRFTKTSYAMASRAVSMVAGQGSAYADPVTTTTYDFVGRVVSTSDCTANATGVCNTVIRTAATTYDAAGRVLSTTSGQGRPTFYSYDPAGQLTGITQRVTPATRYRDRSRRRPDDGGAAQGRRP